MKMTKPKLYLAAMSPGSRSVLLAEKVLNLDLEHVNVNIWNGEQNHPDFLKLNPQHTVPTLDDNGDVICDSHAIVTYLVSKYGGDEYASLCPTEPFERAKLDQRLHFNNSTLFNRFGKMFGPVARGLLPNFQEDAIKSVMEAVDYLEIFLTDDEYVAGSNLTVADFCFIALVTTIFKLIPFDDGRHPKVAAWIARLTVELPDFDEINTQNLEALYKWVQERINQWNE